MSAKVALQPSNGYAGTLREIQSAVAFFLRHKLFIETFDESIFDLFERSMRDVEEARELGVGWAGESLRYVPGRRTGGAAHLTAQIDIARQRGLFDEFRNQPTKFPGKLPANQVLKAFRTHAGIRVHTPCRQNQAQSARAARNRRTFCDDPLG